MYVQDEKEPEGEKKESILPEEKSDEPSPDVMSGGSFRELSGMNWTAPLRFVCNLSYLLDLIWMLL